MARMAGSTPAAVGLPELLERSDELAELAGLFEEVRLTSSGRLCLIGGEAGVGKTALVRRFSTSAEVARVLWGACDPLFTPRPLGPFLDIAERVGGELRRLGRSRARPYEVARALTEVLSAEKPTVVVLEDLQWADEATIDVVRLLGRRVESMPALLIATYRDDELVPAHPLRFLLGGLPRDASISRLKLRPLSPAAVNRLAATARVDADELYRKTAGNPFFVTEALASAHDEQIPPTIRDAVLARAARLSSDARALLDAVAVARPQAELWLLEAVSPAHLGALGECLASGMLARENGSVAFRHELARLAVEDSIAPDRSLHLHRLALAALSGSHHAAADPARLAHHAEAANDTEAVLRFGRLAGDRASAVGAHREAAAQFRRAVKAAAALSAPDHADLLEKLAHEELHISQVDRAIVTQGLAIELYRKSGDTSRWGDALRRQSRLYLCGGLGREAEEPIQTAIQLLETLPPGRELARAYSGLAMLHMNHDRARQTADAATRAVELGEGLDDPETVLHALNSHGTMEVLTYDPRGKEKLLRSLDMAEELGLDEDVGRAYINLGGALLRTRSYDGLVELLSRGIDYCHERGLDLWRMWLLAAQAQAYLDRCDWPRAVDTAEMVLQGERGQLPRVSALPVIALVRARRGDPGVWPVLDEAKSMADREGELQYAVPVSLARAEAAWIEGRLEAIGDETEAAVSKAIAHDAWWLLGELLCWRRRAGLRDDLDPRIPDRYRAEIEGDPRRAADLWSAIGCEYESALALASADDEELLKQAHTRLQRLGARSAAAVVARRLRDRGARGIARGPRSSTRRNPGRLTEREKEVLGLVSAGMRNADIAKRLFLTTKTVDHHVSAILRKLEVSTRVEAAREAARLDIGVTT